MQRSMFSLEIPLYRHYNHNGYRIVSLNLQVKESNMAEYCSCAGKFSETIQRNDFKELLVTFKNISEYVTHCFACV